MRPALGSIFLECDFEQQVINTNLPLNCAGNLLHRTLYRRKDFMFHFHGFEYRQTATLLDALTFLDRDLRDPRGARRREHNLDALGHGGRGIGAHEVRAKEGCNEHRADPGHPREPSSPETSAAM